MKSYSSVARLLPVHRGGRSSVTLSQQPVAAADISGAGATFPYPIYAKWADAYKRSPASG